MAKKRIELFLTGPTREIPSGQNGPILAARVATQNAGSASSFPLADSAMHIVNDLFAIVIGVAQINFHQRQVISIYCTNLTFSPLSCGGGYGGGGGGGGGGENLRWVDWLRNPKSKCK